MLDMQGDTILESGSKIYCSQAALRAQSVAPSVLLLCRATGARSSLNPAVFLRETE